MKIALFIAFLFCSLSIEAQSDEHMVIREICDCFEINDTVVTIDSNPIVKSCLENKNDIIGSVLKSYLRSSARQVELLHQLGDSCKYFVDFMNARYELDDNLTDRDRIETIYKVLNYFDYWQTIDREPRQLTIQHGQAGVLHNILLNKSYPDSIYYEGIYSIPTQDSIILFDIREVRVNFQVEHITLNELNISVAGYVSFQLNQDSIGHILENLSRNYQKYYIVPEVIRATRTVFINFYSEEAKNNEFEDIESLILKSLREKQLKTGYFDFKNLELTELQMH